MEISQNFVAFSEYMNFNNKTIQSTYSDLYNPSKGQVCNYKYLIETSDKIIIFSASELMKFHFFHYSEYHYHKFVNTAKKAIKTFAGCFIGHETGPLEHFKI